MKTCGRLLLLLFLISVSVRAETPPRNHAEPTPTVISPSSFQISAELFGAGLFYSLFASYRLPLNFVINAGASFLPLNDSATSNQTTVNASVNLISFPVSLSYLIGGPNSYLELLGGGNIGFSNATVSGGGIQQGFTDNHFIPEFGIGYRYWPADGGFHFRATLYGIITDVNFYPWAGLSFGYAF